MLANNRGQERHQARSLSLQRGESIARRCQDSTASTIWITTTTDVSTGGFLALPPLTGVGARGVLRKAPVVDLSSSSHEGDLIVDVSRDKAFARRIFGDLNHDVLGSPGDSSSSVTPMKKKRRCVRRRLPALKLCLLLLQGP